MSDQSRSVTFVIWERLRVKTVKKVILSRVSAGVREERNV